MTDLPPDQVARQHWAASNRGLINEFVASMQRIGVPAQTVEVVAVAVVTKKVRTGLFARERRQVVESTPVGSFSAWTTPVDGDLVGVTPDGLMFVLGRDPAGVAPTFGPTVTTEQVQQFHDLAARRLERDPVAVGRAVQALFDAARDRR